MNVLAHIAEATRARDRGVEEESKKRKEKSAIATMMVG